MKRTHPDPRPGCERRTRAKYDRKTNPDRGRPSPPRRPD